MQAYSVTTMPPATLHHQVPADLQDLDQWVVWRLTHRPGKPKPDKIPYNPNTGKLASSTDPASWGTFDAAVATLTANSKNYSGIGFVLTKDSGIVGIDLDHSIDDTGQLNEWASPLAYNLDSYTEISPSGQGIRIFIRAIKPSTRCKKGNIEVYDSGRFLTVTGRRYYRNDNLGINERQAELEAFMSEVFGPAEAVDEEAEEAAPQARQGQKYTGIITLDPNADPPFKKWAALSRLTPQAGRYFDHKGKMPKTKEGADDLSAIELALANLAVNAGWGDQEVVNLLIAHRVHWGEKPKHRRYYELTLMAAHDRDLRQGVIAGTHAPAKSPAVDAVAAPEAVDAAEPVEAIDAPPDAAEEAYSLEEDAPPLLGPEGVISAALGIEVADIIKYDSQPPTYQVVAVKGGVSKSVRLGKVGQLIQQGYLREAIAAIDHYIPPISKDQWPTVAQWLLDACRVVEVGDDAQEAGQVKVWLEAYLSDKKIKEEFQKAITNRSPYRQDGVLYVFGSDLRTFIATALKEHITPQDFGAKMRLTGAKPVRVSYQKGDNPTSVQVWRLPDGY